MAKGFKCGGGANPLNFKVVGNPQPETAKDNTIWVDTDEKITGWVFGAAQPAGAEGMVWIQTGTASAAEFNALKKNGITVCPLSAKQYVGGAWVDKAAKSHQGGKWVDWIRKLYENGNLIDGQTLSIIANTGNGAKLASDCIQFRMTSTATYAVAAFDNPVDMTDVSMIKITFFSYRDYVGAKQGDWGTDFSVALSTDKQFNGFNNDSVYAKIGEMRANTEYELTLDVSAVTGKFYILIPVTWGEGSWMDVDVRKVELK